MSEDLTYYHAPERPMPSDCPDPIVEAVREKLKLRSQIGQRKYGTMLTRTDIDMLGWIRHAQEEALDLAVYLERLMAELWLRMDDGK